MALKDNLTKEVSEIFRFAWDVQDATSVPDPTDLRLGSNHAKRLESVAVLYADLDGSTQMVNSQAWTRSAEVYKSFLRCASQIIRSESGVITAYDGDRVMGVFAENPKNTRAVRCALKIHWAVKYIIQPAFNKQYGTDYVIKHVVGVDTSEVRTARIGVHGDNDLVWIGRSPNYAAKLTSLSADYPTWITGSVYNAMFDEVKYSNGINMWEPRTWTSMNKMRIYRSSYWWSFE